MRLKFSLYLFVPSLQIWEKNTFRLSSINFQLTLDFLYIWADNNPGLTHHFATYLYKALEQKNKDVTH